MPVLSVFKLNFTEMIQNYGKGLVTLNELVAECGATPSETRVQMRLRRL